ncbi:MAG: yqjQ1 [Gemmatimonadetes bacterium]|nr:yqjQ1 [Gemmatimonadota bacterium]
MGGWSYAGRWALVTGASAGIGEAFARALAGRGMHVALSARREDRLRELAEELRSAHSVETAVLPADLSGPGAASGLWSMATAGGRSMSLLVNNAGFGLRGEFTELPLDRQQEMLRLNCAVPMELMHLALAAGTTGIINVASIAGYQPVPTMAAYSASKAFLLTLSEAVAEEMRGTSTRIVTVNPGPVATEFQRVAGTSVTRRTLGLRTPEQVVGAALRTLEAGGGTVVPGLTNRLSAVVVRVAPRSLVLKVAKKMMKSFR